MAGTWKTVRVFISSTFRDMQAERDHLVRFVFPRLREDLLKHRIHLIDVDLRWGVTSEQDAVGVCREVIDECRPRFMGILGGRYGWVPEGKTESITADEIHYAVLGRPKENRGQCFFYFRDEDATRAMVETTPGDYREAERSTNAEKLAELKHAIVKAALPLFIYPARWSDTQGRLTGLEAFGGRVYADLIQSLKADPELADRFTAEDDANEPDEFTEEAHQMDAFIEERTERFVLGSREPLMRDLLAFAATDGTPNVFVLTGEPGSGKSAFLAKFTRELSDLHHSPITIPHFIGTSTGSTDLRRTLRRLCHELAQAAGNTEPLPLDIKDLITHFQKLLTEAAAKKRIILVFDALNQFDATDSAHWLNWLPRELPPGLRIVASVIAPLEGENEHQTLAILRNRNDSRVETLKPLDESDTLAIIEGYLNRYAKRLSPEQIAALQAKSASNLPLYILTALEELRTLGTYEEITERIHALPCNAGALFSWILTERLAHDPGFRDKEGQTCGAALVEKFSACLGVSRHGLSQNELAAILAPEPDAKNDKLGNVSALLRLLHPYLMRRGELLDFYHGQFREAAKYEWLRTEIQRLSAHRALATHFYAAADPGLNGEWRGDSRHALSELPFHQTQSKLWMGLERSLCNLNFIEAKCRAGLGYALTQDYEAAIAATPEMQEERANEEARRDQCRRYASALATYAEGQRAGSQFQLPEPPPICDLSAALYDGEQRTIRNELALGVSTWGTRLQRFSGFVSSHRHVLVSHSEWTTPIARNHAETGAITSQAADLLAQTEKPWIERLVRPSEPPLNAVCWGILEGHKGWVSALIVSADGSRAMSASRDMTLRFWNVDTGECIAVFEGHTSGVFALAANSNFTKAISGGADRTLRIWDLENQICLGILEGHTSCVQSLAVSADFTRAVSGSVDTTLRIWDLEERKCIAVLREHEELVDEGHLQHPGGQVEDIVVDARFSRVLSASFDNTLRMWDLETHSCAAVLKGHRNKVNSVVADSELNRAASASYDQTLRLWNLKNGQRTTELSELSSLASGLASDPRLSRIISANSEGSLEIWDVRRQKRIGMLHSHGEVGYAKVAADLTLARALSASRNTIRIWNLAKGECSERLASHRERISAVAINESGSRAVSASWDGTLRVWKFDNNKANHTRSEDLLRWWPFSRVKSGAARPEVACMLVIEACDNWIYAVAGDANLSRAVSGSADGCLRVWDLETGKCLAMLKGHYGGVNALTCDSRLSCVISGGFDRTVRVWNMEQGLCESVLAGHTGCVNTVAADSSMGQALSGSDDGSLRLWDLRTKRCSEVIEGNGGGVNAVVVNSNFSQAISGGKDSVLRIWDLKSRKCLAVLAGHKSVVTQLAATPDFSSVISSSEDSTLRIWDISRQQCVAVYYASAAVDSTTSISSTGRMYCGTRDGQLHSLALRN